MDVDAGNETLPGLVEPECTLRRLWLKDISFEAPNSPHVLYGHPPLTMVFSVSSCYTLNPWLESCFDVLLTVTITATGGDRTLFLIEIQQGGTFVVRGYTEASDIRAVLQTKAPEALFPFVRELVSSLVHRGGFARLQLAPIDFEALFAAHRVEAAPA